MDIYDLRGSRLYLDANVWIYAREDNPRFSRPARAIMKLLAHGELHAVTSEWTLAEVLIGPIREVDRAAQKAYRAQLQNNDRLVVHPVSREVLLEAARLTALHALTLPDAVHAATAKLSNCKYLVSGDEGFRGIAVVPWLPLGSIEIETD